MAATRRYTITARVRLLICALLGIATAVLVTLAGRGQYAALAAWDVAGVTYAGSVLLMVLRFDEATTKSHALSENPGRAAGDVLLLVASLASLFAVGLLIVQAGNASGTEKLIDVALGLGSVIISWGVVHTIFLLTYARLYYGEPQGGISFSQPSAPRYADFAYVAFTIGMTFQVSDTELGTKRIRATALKHALLSYVFGTVIIASTINFLAGLSK